VATSSAPAASSTVIFDARRRRHDDRLRASEGVKQQHLAAGFADLQSLQVPAAGRTILYAS